ncbi:hypothetical protein DEU56DRAFT_911741 [Suillus clintonianus]|uniref:uncharacterized protein n=1 Tax=Suillus clintonianus TaxID=1904413 RepID=UPI001B8638C4|nr:uncharacterized protein DEU56DRAFT_911741 [Suillus clintonianus]KAG2140674.1 hypothetical protein DEU56DRAFT_911741 [Suillus clintonianus]
MGRTSGQLPETGNVANAALAAKEVVKKAIICRKNIFKKAKLPLLGPLDDACISALRPLKVDDFAIAYTEWGLRISRVIAIYSKGGGKNGKHAAVDKADTIAGVSYLGVQIYQQHFRCHFRSIPDATAMYQCNQFAFIPSTAFFYLMEFDILSTALPQLAEAAKLFRKRTSRNGTTQRDEEGNF